MTTITYEPNSDMRQSVEVDGAVTTLHYDAAGRADEREDVIDTNIFTTKFGPARRIRRGATTCTLVRG